MAKTPEGKIKDAVKKVVDKHISWQFWPVQTGYGKAALDAFVLIYGYWFVIETKAPGEVPTPRQKITIDQIRRAGGTVLLIDSMEKVQQFSALCDKLFARVQHGQSSSTGLSTDTAAEPVVERASGPPATEHVADKSADVQD